MSDEDKDSKTELPTEKKISDAMEKGNTPFSREITIFASTLAIYLFLVFFLPGGLARMNETLRDFFELELRVWPGPSRLAAHLDFHGNWIEWLL